MSKESFTLKEVVVEMRQELAHLNAKMDSMTTDHTDNTLFRKRAINAIVGFTFMCLVTLGGAILKTLGIINIGK